MGQGAGGSFGGVITVSVPSNGTAYAKGDFWAKGGVAGVCLDAIAAGASGSVQLMGVLKNVPKTNSNVNISAGDKLYCADNANSVNKTSTSRIACGYALAASGNGTANVDVILALGVA